MRRLHLVLITSALLLVAALTAWLLRGGAGEDDSGAAAVLGHAPSMSRDAAGFAADGERKSVAAPQRLELAPAPSDIGAAAEPAVAATAPDPAVAPGDEATFRGRVVDDTGAPIAGATVVYWPTEVSMALYGLAWDACGGELDVLPRALTDGAGRFEVRGRYRTGKGVTGMNDEPMLAVIFGDDAVRSHRCADFTGEDYDAGDIALEPGARLVGRIVDESGGPIAGVLIQPWNPRGRSLRGVLDLTNNSGFGELTQAFCATTSGADGRFRTGALWDGKTQLTIKAEGFLDEWRDYVPVKVGASNDLGDIVLSRGDALVGLVRDAQGAPVADARVVAWEAMSVGLWDTLAREHDTLLKQLEEHAREESARTDAAGRFLLAAQRHSNHSVFVDVAGFEPLRVDDVLPGGAGLTLTLTRAATLHLAVLDAATQQPVVAAQVQARRLSGWKGDTTGVELPVSAGDAPGTFLVARLGLRRTELIVEAPGYATCGLALDGASPPECVERTIELHREARLTGIVTAADGTPLAAASVDATPPRDGPVSLPKASVATDAQGRYVLAALSPGEWSLRADAKDYGAVEQQVTVSAGLPLADVDFALPAAASLFGISYASDGTRQARDTLRFAWIDPQGRKNVEPLREIVTDERGRYEARDLRPGTWRLVGNLSLDVTLAPGEQRQLDLHEEPTARIEGRVLRADGAPVPHAWIFVNVTRTGLKHRFPAFERADEQGRYAWTKGWLGRAELVAAAPDGGGMSAPVAFELLKGEQRLVDLRLGALEVRGRAVRDEDGSPVTGASVRVIPLLDDDTPGAWGAFTMNGTSVDFGAASDVEGRFVVRNLAPGRFSVTVAASGARAARQPTLVLTGGTTPELEIRVTRTGSLAGTAHTPSGVPVKDNTLVSAEGPDQTESASVDSGRFELKDLMPGKWRVFIKRDDAVLAEQSVTVLSGQQPEVELIVP